MKAHAASPTIEPRWPVALTMIVEVFLLAALPGRIRTLPVWSMPALLVMTLLPMAALAVSAEKSWWLRIERIFLLLFLFISTLLLLHGLRFLLSAMLHKTNISGIQLLESSIAAWTGNVLICSLVYWRMDRGGPERRCNDVSTKPDWLFPHKSAGEHVPPNWHPTYVDYLFLAFCTATAFSPTDALPLTSAPNC